MTRVLVTGATGFIGRGVVPRLVGRGYDVHAVTSREPEPRSSDVRWHRADLLAPGACERLIAAVRPRHAVHLAWHAEPRSFWTSPENLRWLGASIELVRAFGAHGGERFVGVGSCAEHAWGGPRPHRLYGATKHALHVVAAELGAAMGFELAWARVFFAYGPGEARSRLVSSIASRLLRGEHARCSEGLQRRDFVFVDDVAEAIACILSSRLVGAVDVGSGEAPEVADVVRFAAQAAGRPELVLRGAIAADPDEPDEIRADASRLRREAGWSASVPLEQGIERTVASWRERLAEDGSAGA